MTKKQIEQAAKEYADKNCKSTDEYDYSYIYETAFIAGAELREAEIDELVRTLITCYGDITNISLLKYLQTILDKYEV